MVGGTRAAKIASTLTAAALSALLMTFAATSPASALGADTEDASGGTTTQPGPGTGSGGGGGASEWAYRTYEYNASSAIIQGCAATDSRGEALLGANAKWRFPAGMGEGELVAAIKGGAAAEAAAQVSLVSKGCQYPPPYNWRSVKVIIGSTASVQRVLPTSETLQTAGMQTRWGQGDHSLSALYASTSSSASVNVNLSVLGRYSATANTTAAWVTVKDYVGSTPDEITSISAPFVSNSSSAKGQLTCAGWSDDWSGNPTWTFTDCGPTTTIVATPTYSCSALDPSLPATTIDRIDASEAVLFRNGDEHLVQWSTMAPSSGITVTDTSTRWTRSGTPWRENSVSIAESLFALSQFPSGNSIFNSDSGTSWVKGTQDSAFVKGYWASTTGLPTVISPQWNYFGTMQQAGVTITGISSDGTWTTSPTTVTVDSSAICAGPAVSLNYVRAVGR